MSKQTDLMEQASQARQWGDKALEAKLLAQAQAMTHRDAYPEQYSHPMVGKRVNVMHKGNIVCTGTIERVTSSRFGQMARIDTAAKDTFYLLSSCREAA
jgi:hypothetical protein